MPGRSAHALGFLPIGSSRSTNGLLTRATAFIYLFATKQTGRRPGMADEYLDVVIIGAGLSGIGAARYLRTRLPHKTFAILESKPRVGGTWDLFRYPGIRSDS